MTLRKLIRVLHRDLGYFFFGLSIIYAVSGIALNHIRDFNPNYVIRHYNLEVPAPINDEQIDEVWVNNILTEYDIKNEYKKFYFPTDDQLKVFLKNGNLTFKMSTGEGLLETINKRPVFNQMNFLHYNPGVWWKWFSDIFCVAWIIISITGLFIIKSGKHSIMRRGAAWTIAGIIVPIIFLILYR
jgi:hypothetical protein